VIGLPWIVHELVRPRSERTHAFALVALMASLLLFYASNNAGLDERYAIYYTPPLVVAAVVAITCRELRPAWVIAGGILGAWLLHHEGWPQSGGGFSYFTAPAESFYSRVGLLKLSVHLPSSISPRTGALLIALAATAVIAYGFSRRRGAALVLGAAVGGLVVVQLAQADYAMTKYVNGPGGRFGPSAKARAFVDETIPRGAHAGILAVGQGNYPAFDYAWRDVQFWNSSVTSQFATGGFGISLIPGDQVGTISARPQDGRVSTRPLPLPRYILMPRTYAELGLVGPIVRPSPYLPIDLIRRTEPAQLRYRVLGGAAQDGLLRPDAPSKLRVYRTRLAPGNCARITVAGPAPAAGARPMRFRIGIRSGRLDPGAQFVVVTPLSFGKRPYVDVPITATGPPHEFPQLGVIVIGTCD